MLKQSRNYCFTNFNMKMDIEYLYNKNKDIIRYICAGKEVAKTTGREHLQGWVQFKNKKRLGGVKNVLEDKKIHLEACRGDAFSNDKYCAKEGKFVSYGKFVCQGQRTDLEAIQKEIQDGATKCDIMTNFFSTYCRYRKGILDYLEVSVKKNTKKFRKLNVEFHYGSTDSGKTRFATETHPEHYMILGANMQWFDGYNQEKVLIIDDYNNDVPITKMLRLLDGYQFRLPIKGNHTYANWDKVIITSNLSIDELHLNAKPEHRRALLRRIHKFVKYTNL